MPGISRPIAGDGSVASASSLDTRPATCRRGTLAPHHTKLIHPLSSRSTPLPHLCLYLWHAAAVRPPGDATDEIRPPLAVDVSLLAIHWSTSLFPLCCCKQARQEALFSSCWSAAPPCYKRHLWRRDVAGRGGRSAANQPPFKWCCTPATLVVSRRCKAAHHLQTVNLQRDFFTGEFVMFKLLKKVVGFVGDYCWKYFCDLLQSFFTTVNSDVEIVNFFCCFC